jgi:hypothetical protein
VISARLIAAGVGLAALVALYFVGDARGAARIQARFDAFQFEQKTLADAQQEMINDLELARERDRALLEAQNAKAVADIHERYAADRLREQSGAGANGVPTGTDAARVCDDPADNDRLFDAVQRRRGRVRDLLEQAEVQARTMITCQAFAAAISREGGP